MATDPELSRLIKRYFRMFPKGRKLRLLLVDNESSVGDYLTPFLSIAAPGIRLDQVFTVENAMERIHSDPGSIDALIIDLRMHKRGGIDLLQDLHKEKRYYPFVVYSGEHAVSEQSDIVPLLRRFTSRATFAEELRNGASAFAGNFVSKNDPLELLLLELLYRHRMYTIKHEEPLKEFCKRLTQRHRVETPEETLVAQLVEATTCVRNLLESFLYQFEHTPEITKVHLNRMSNGAQEVNPIARKTFTNSARAFFFEETPGSKPILAYTVQELNRLFRDDPSELAHDLRRYGLLHLEPGDMDLTRSPLGLYPTLRGTWGYGGDRDLDTLFEFQDTLECLDPREEPAYALLHQFNTDVERPARKVIALGDLIAKQLLKTSGVWWQGISKVQTYLENRGIHVNNTASTQDINFNPNSLEFGLYEFIHNAANAGGRLTHVDIEETTVARLPKTQGTTMRAYKRQHKDLKGHNQVVVMSFYDDGPGFDRSHLRRGTYFKNRDTDGFKGGLAITKETVENMLGCMKIGNYKGSGCIKLYFFAR